MNLGFRSRVFLGQDNRPYMVKLIDGNIWTHILNGDKSGWVTYHKTPVAKGRLFLDNLSDFEQSLYPPILE